MAYIGDNYILWKGSWESSNFDNVYGTITVPLIKVYESNYITDAIISFDGSYNRDKTVIISVNVDNVEMLNQKKVNYLKFETIIEGQEIKYFISIHNQNKIGGIYKSTTPPDVGIIELKPTNERTIDYGDNRRGWCVIC